MSETASSPDAQDRRFESVLLSPLLTQDWPEEIKLTIVGADGTFWDEAG